MTQVIGWDIGGVNTKGARVSNGDVRGVATRPFELQRDPQALVPLLRTLARELGSSKGDVHAVTMTAELSQMFRTKREGVGFVLDAVDEAFREAGAIGVFAVDGRFLSTDEARRQALAVAAANWAATAKVVARDVPNALLVDIGTTTTDIIPIVSGMAQTAGLTDPDRLASGELVYTGAVRTPVEAMASLVPFRGADAGVAAEGFALAGDIHLWRGDIEPDDYTCPTPDGRPVTRQFASERIARTICADRDILDECGVSAIADALADAQVARIADAMRRVLTRHPGIRVAVVTGLGAFVAARAAERVGMSVTPLASALGDLGARCAPAAAVALLADAALREGTFANATAGPAPSDAARTSVVDVVVKVGGALLEHEGCLDRVLALVSEASRHRSFVIVPGGGPFADAVRHQDARIGLSADAAHWMAVLAMDQYAELIVSRLGSARLVTDAAGIAAAHRSESIPVLAPSAWLRRVDPLPHTWEVTSDSIAAWVAGEVHARRLLLVKPPQAGPLSLVDAFFERALPSGVSAFMLMADQDEAIRRALLEPERDGVVER